jgi:hypothetical protein
MTEADWEVEAAVTCRGRMQDLEEAHSGSGFAWIDGRMHAFDGRVISTGSAEMEARAVVLRGSFHAHPEAPRVAEWSADTLRRANVGRWPDGFLAALVPGANDHVEGEVREWVAQRERTA